jgi:hypothetical protein
MGLIKCSTCGAEIAKDAKTCPKCGTEKPWMSKGRKNANKIAAVIFGVLFIGTCAAKQCGSEGKSAGTGQPPPAAQAAAAAATPEPAKAAASKTATAPTAAAAKIGQVVELADSVWVVLSAKNAGSVLKSNNEFQEPAKTDGKFIVVRFKVTNKTPKEERIVDQPKVIDSLNREFGHHDEEAFYIPKNAKTIGLEALPSSMAKEFWSVYEVPADATGLKFVARELSAFGDTKPIDLAL